MTTIHHEVQANCPPERVWALLSDLEAVQHYNPTVRAAAVQGTRRTGVGAERACALVPKGRVVERVTHWEDGRAVGIEVAESDWPIHFMRWITRVEPAGNLFAEPSESVDRCPHRHRVEPSGRALAVLSGEFRRAQAPALTTRAHPGIYRGPSACCRHAPRLSSRHGPLDLGSHEQPELGAG